MPLGWPTRIRQSRRAARLVTWSPRSSMPRTQREVTATRAAARITSGYRASRCSGSQTLESSRRDSERISRRPSRSRSNSTPAATRGPARLPRPASSAPAMKRRPNERSKTNRRRAVRRRFGLEDPDALDGPVREEGLSDEPVFGHGSPEPAVVTRPTIVAHHKKVARRNFDRPREVAAAGCARVDVVGMLLLPVHDRVAVSDGDRVSGKGDDPLDEVHVGFLLHRARADLVLTMAGPALVALSPFRRVEDDHITPAGVADLVVDSAHEDALANVERRLHRLARDPVRLDEESLDGERQTERHRHDQDQFEQGVAPQGAQQGG